MHIETWQAAIPFVTWGLTQGIKVVLPTRRKRFPKRWLPLITVGAGAVIGGVSLLVEPESARTVIDGVLQVVTSAGLGTSSIALHELGESVVNAREQQKWAHEESGTSEVDNTQHG